MFSSILSETIFFQLENGIFTYIYHTNLGGEKPKYFWNISPPIWGNDPIWRAYSLKPPTSGNPKRDDKGMTFTHCVHTGGRAWTRYDFVGSLYHGILHHFSPPFGLIFLELFPSILDANSRSPTIIFNRLVYKPLFFKVSRDFYHQSKWTNNFEVILTSRGRFGSSNLGKDVRPWKEVLIWKVKPHVNNEKNLAIYCI